MSDEIEVPTESSEETQAPEVVTVEGEAPAVEAAPKEPDKFSRQHKVYLKQQAELLKQKSAFEQERQQHQSQLETERAELAQYKAWKEQTDNGNPWEFLRANKYDLDALYKLALKEEQDPKLVAANVAKELEAKYDAKFAAMEREKEEHAAAQEQAAIDARKAATSTEIQTFLQANAEQYELLSTYENAPSYVLDTIWNVYEMSEGQQLLTYEQAASAAEEYLESEMIRNNPYLKTAKAKQILLANADGDVITNDTKTSAARPAKDRRSKQPSRVSQSNAQPRTLRNKMASVSTPAQPNKETFAQRKVRLFEELKKGTWKPKPEHLTQ